MAGVRSLSRASIERAAIEAARETEGSTPTETAIARHAMAAPSTLYGYFDNLDSIIAAAVVRLRRRFRASLWGMPSLQALVDTTAEIVRENADLAHLFFERTDADTVVPAPPNITALLSNDLQRAIDSDIARGAWTDTMGILAHRWLSLKDPKALALEIERMAVPTLRLTAAAALAASDVPRHVPDIESMIDAVRCRLETADDSTDLQQRLVVAAWDLILEAGPAGVTIRQLGKLAGMGIGTVHRNLDRRRINATIDQALLDVTIHWLQGLALQTGVEVVGALFGLLDEVDRRRPELMQFLLKPPTTERNGFEQAIDMAITADATPEATAIWSGSYHSLVLGVWATRVLRAQTEPERRRAAHRDLTAMLALLTSWNDDYQYRAGASIHLGGYTSSLLPRNQPRQAGPNNRSTKA